MLIQDGTLTLTAWILVAIGAGMPAIFVANAIITWLAGIVARMSQKSLAKQGKWAVVTGGSRGIGLAYAINFAKQGLNVLILSRGESGLREGKAAIEDKVSGAVVKYIASDIGAAMSADDTCEELVEQIKASTDGGNVAVLVNCAGLSYPGAMRFHEIGTEKFPDSDTQLISRLCRLNMESMARLTHAVLPWMVAKKAGTVINISSGNGRLPMGAPMYALYSGSKAFVDYFSRSLNAEYTPLGIQVESHSPNFVISDMSGYKAKHKSFTIVTPAEYASAAVQCIGKYDSVTPVFSHWLQDYVVQLLPLWLSRGMIAGMHSGLRAKHLRKIKRDSEAKGASGNDKKGQ